MITNLILAGTIGLSGLGVTNVAEASAIEATQENAVTSTVRDAGATIVLKLTNNTETITRSDVIIQEFRSGEWVEPDYNQTFSILYPEAGWNYEELYYLKGNGGELPSKGTFRFKIVTSDYETEQHLETTFSEQFIIK